jgi:hypothetical protein
MGFQLRQLRLHVATPTGPFGTELSFVPGLNVLRAPNTSGKSTCVQAILFALGLEGMLGPAREVPLPHAMTHTIEDADGEEHAVTSSQVLLEIIDDEERPVTIRRHPAHPRLDSNLVSVWGGALPSDLHDLDDRGRQDFYVRRPGAAQREAGFHHFLARRLGWSLPEVPRYQGGAVPLYLETLAPLWFVEQKRGWSGIQAQTPTYLGIRDVRRRALEFTLRLDVQERAARIEQLLTEQREISAEWSAAVGAIQAASRPLGVSVESLPQRPTVEWPPSTQPRLRVSTADEWEDLPERLRTLRSELAELQSRPTPEAGSTAESETQQLRNMEEQLRRVDRLASGTSRQLELERATANDAHARLQAVNEDIRRHQDLLVLQGMGSTLDHTVTREDCPTCHKPLNDVLLDPEDVPAVLAADASVELLEKQRELFSALVQDAERVVAARESRMRALRTTASDLRSSLRAVKDSLAGPSATPSVATIERAASLRRRISDLEELRDEWLVVLERLAGLAVRWANVRSELEALRQSDYSNDDRSKLTALEESFRVQLRSFGFQSCPVEQVGLSLDDYMPTHEGFELALDFSASDGIRIIWAYLMGLLDVSREFATNHPGLVVFDEPRQQAAAELSFSVLLRRAADIANHQSQVLFATSEAPSSLARMLNGTEAHVQEYDSKVIRRLL